MPLAVDDPHATLAVVQAFGQEGGQLVPGFVPIHAVQVEFGLNDPATAPQVAENADRQAVAQVVRFVAAFQAILQADLAVQAFMQGGPFVSDGLLRSRWRERAAEMDAIRG